MKDRTNFKGMKYNNDANRTQNFFYLSPYRFKTVGVTIVLQIAPVRVNL